MITVFLTFIKGKLTSKLGSFLIMLAVIIGAFVLFNSNVILSKFGFETTTVLKAELAKTQKDLERTAGINNELNAAILRQEQENKFSIDALSETYKELNKYKSKTDSVIKVKDGKDILLIKNIDKKIVITNTAITMPIDEYNKLSESNINSLNEVYAILFNDITK